VTYLLTIDIIITIIITVGQQRQQHPQGVQQRQWLLVTVAQQQRLLASRFE
jgi:hypothetical protein